MTKIYKYDVFISHSRTNGYFARALAGRLRELDFRVWIPGRLALDGSNRIMKAMEDSAVCVLLFSNDGESPWTDKAIWSAISNRIYRSDGKFRVIPILFQAAPELESTDLITKLTGYWSNPLQQRGSFVRFGCTVTEDAVRHLVLRIRGVKDSEPSWKETLKDEVKLRARHLISVDWRNWANKFGQNSLGPEFKWQIQLDPDRARSSQLARPSDESLLKAQVQQGRDRSFRSVRSRLKEPRQEESTREPLRLSRNRDDLITKAQWVVMPPGCEIQDRNMHVVENPYSTISSGCEDRNSAGLVGHFFPVCSSCEEITFSFEIKEKKCQEEIDKTLQKSFLSELIENDQVNVIDTFGCYLSAYCDVLQSHNSTLPSHSETQSGRYFIALSKLRTDESRYLFPSFLRDLLRCCQQHAVRESHLIRWEPLNYDVGDLVDSCNESMTPHTKYKSKIVNENRGSGGAYAANKIIVDMSGGNAPQHGLCGKDPTTVDRSSAYMARYIGKNIVATSITDKCQVQLACAIGVAKPASGNVHTCESERIGEVQTYGLVHKHFSGMIMGIGRSTGAIASLGDRIKVTIKEAASDGVMKKGTVTDAVIVRTRKEVRRRDGTYVRFDQNAAVLIKEDGTPIGTRVFGPATRELSDTNYMKIVVPDSKPDSFDSVKERLSHFLGLCTGEKIDQLPR